VSPAVSDGLIGPGAFAALLGFRAVAAEITQSGRVVARATTTNMVSG
jgi:hypothetical protein